MLKRARLQSQKGINSAQNSHDLIERNDKIEKQMQVLVSTFKQYSEQNSRLTNLYDHAKIKNEKLLKVNLKLRQDVSFLKSYCTLIEAELQKLGFQNSCNSEMLSRKETAEGILLTLDDSDITEDENGALDLGFSQFRRRIVSLEQENKMLRDQLLRDRQSGLSKSVPRSGCQQQGNIWRKAYEASDEKVGRLEWQVKQLKKLNDNLQMQRMKRGITNFILKDREQIFNNIHRIISDYKKKIKQLASEKKDAYRKYKHLKQKLNNRMEQTSQLKLLEIYTQKIDILQKLTEKQQIEIENTIQLYEVELKKIQQRRCEEINLYEDARLDLQTENLKLHIDLQKSLNRRDDLSLEIAKEKNKKQIITAENAQMKQKIELLMNQGLRKSLGVHILSNVVEISISPQSKQKQKPLDLSDANKNLQKMMSRLDGQEQSNVAGPLYSSHIFQKKQLQGYHLTLARRQSSISKNSLRSKITITYNKPCVHGSMATLINNASSSGNVNKTYDSIFQYKKRFIQRKPQSSLNP